MSLVSVTNLRRRAGDVIDRVVAGERVLVTRHGHPVAELRSLHSRGLPATELLDRWRRVPVVEATTLRNDIDTLLDPRT